MEIEEIKNKLVKDVIITDDTISIRFNDTEYCVIICAIGECCSKSYFELNEESFIAKMIGTTINNIVINEEIDCDESEENRECKVTPIKIITDNEDINFKLINISNGYYSGWFEIKSGINIF